MLKLNQGAVVSLGLSECKKRVRLVAAYGSPLLLQGEEGEKVSWVSWEIKRAFSVDAKQVWEARAFNNALNRSELNLAGLGGLSYCRSASFRTLVTTMGVRRSIGSPSLRGAQEVFTKQVDCENLPYTVASLRHLPGYHEAPSPT